MPILTNDSCGLWATASSARTMNQGNKFASGGSKGEAWIKVIERA